MPNSPRTERDSIGSIVKTASYENVNVMFTIDPYTKLGTDSRSFNDDLNRLCLIPLTIWKTDRPPEESVNLDVHLAPIIKNPDTGKLDDTLSGFFMLKDGSYHIEIGTNVALSKLEMIKESKANDLNLNDAHYVLSFLLAHEVAHAMIRKREAATYHHFRREKNEEKEATKIALQVLEGIHQSDQIQGFYKGVQELGPVLFRRKHILKFDTGSIYYREKYIELRRKLLPYKNHY